jgi:hypothetical protein
VNTICVPPSVVAEVWPEARRFIFAAMERVGLQDGAGIEADVLAGRALLWVSYDSPRIIGAAVTTIVNRVCEIVAFGSDDMRASLPGLAEIEDYARAVECRALRIIGRKGWQRALTGYRPVAVILEKDIA